MKRRWEFKRYDYRGNSKGWLHYVGLGPALFVCGFHRSRVIDKAWVEFTLYVGERIDWSIYPHVPLPRRWML